jgi:hypothetical protein
VLPAVVEHEGNGAVGVAGGGQRRAEAPAGLCGGVEVGSGPLLRGLLGVAQCSGNVAGGQSRRGQRAQRPQHDPWVAGQARALDALLGRRAGLGQAAELDQRRH